MLRIIASLGSNLLPPPCGSVCFSGRRGVCSRSIFTQLALSLRSPPVNTKFRTFLHEYSSGSPVFPCEHSRKDQTGGELSSSSLSPNFWPIGFYARAALTAERRALGTLFFLEISVQKKVFFTYLPLHLFILAFFIFSLFLFFWYCYLFELFKLFFLDILL